ncbi:MAG TPA: phosphate ABC transporter substrate-binding protein [Firmicutes bacterium]|jgi:phosphate transport system substrate-binding protein|nr:phosphate ABC transporter substrate-binding protein [Bacillota bacterium]
MFHRSKHVVLILLGLCIVLTLSACGNRQDGARRSKLVILGSTALQPMIEEAARLYRGRNPQVEITVQGGGSGTGMTQVATGTADIGMSDITIEERPELMNAGLVDHPIAIIGFAIAVHPEVNVTTLTKAQVKDIFSGKITNWSAVGGADLPITVINRPEGSGTRSTFNRIFMGNEKAIESITQDSSGAIRRTISDTPGAIGYLAFSYLNDSIKTLHLDGVAPTEDNIRNNSYTFWAYEHLYTKGEPNPEVKAFIDYILSTEIQTTVVPKMKLISVQTAD